MRKDPKAPFLQGIWGGVRDKKNKSCKGNKKKNVRGSPPAASEAHGPGSGLGGDRTIGKGHFIAERRGLNLMY